MPVVYDLTSDTATQPTDDMFDLMKTASRGDDVFSVSFHRVGRPSLSLSRALLITLFTLSISVL